MRSGSSLLLHLLSTNPEVSAVGERNAVYATRADLARLVIATRLAHYPPWRRLRYVADQVNHNKFTPSMALLQDRRARVLFLLRNPQSSIASLLELSRTFYEESWPVSRAIAYYVERLEGLQRIGESWSGRAPPALITYEKLTQQPQRSLEALRAFLDLQRGFSTTYQTYSFTGRRGDPGPNISAGRIVLKDPAAATTLGGADLTRAAEAYARCTAALARFALPSEDLG